MSLETSWGHIPVSKVPLHVYFKICLLSWKTSLTLSSSHFLISCGITHILYELVEHLFEIEDALLGITQELPGKRWVMLPDLIKIDIEFLSSSTLHVLPNLFLNI